MNHPHTGAVDVCEAHLKCKRTTRHPWIRVMFATFVFTWKRCRPVKSEIGELQFKCYHLKRRPYTPPTTRPVPRHVAVVSLSP